MGYILLLFFKSKNKKMPVVGANNDIPEGLIKKCPSCNTVNYTKAISSNLEVCFTCGYHFPISVEERLGYLVDAESFVEFNSEFNSENPLDFPGYVEKLAADKKKTGHNDAIVTGTAKINGQSFVVAIMNSKFRMGSMGSVVGEKILLAIEKAMELQVPFVIFTASGGARMQEGLLSLMQMAKTSAALKKFSGQKGLSIIVMTHPTTGGVSASFASLGDYNLAEPGALIGFAGRRIIEQTIREKLPEDFQTAEFLLKHGQLDAVVSRAEQKSTLDMIFRVHNYGGEKDE